MNLSLVPMKFIACLLVLATFSLSTYVPRAEARMIGTDQAISQEAPTGDRARLHNFLAREDVQDILIAQGISPKEAQTRVAALTDDEVRNMMGQLEQLPAGGGAFSTLIVAFGLVFLVLLVTDILGFTKVFPFTRPIR